MLVQDWSLNGKIPRTGSNESETAEVMKEVDQKLLWQ